MKVRITSTALSCSRHFDQPSFLSWLTERFCTTMANDERLLGAAMVIERQLFSKTSIFLAFREGK
jgi:hypothetical protein